MELLHESGTLVEFTAQIGMWSLAATIATASRYTLKVLVLYVRVINAITT